MIGNVNGIVDSMFAADSIRNRQNTVGGAGNGFSDYLDYALLNSRSGSLFGSGVGIGSNDSYMNGLSGSVWQTFALKALIDGIQKNSRTDAVSADGQQESSGSVSKAGSKPDWARIRVVRHYKAPTVQKTESRGILV